MYHTINNVLIGLNKVGGVFYDYAASVFIQTALLVILLFVIDLFLRKRVRAVFRYCLWLLVLVKLVLPPMLSLPTGIGYWVGDHIPATADVSSRTFDAVGFGHTTQPSETSLAEHSDAPADGGPLFIPASSTLTPVTWQAVLFVLWLVGILAFLAVLVQRIRFVRGLVAASYPAGEELTGLLEECRRQMTIRREIKLRLSRAIPSPAVCGLLRPTILMPTSLFERLSPEGLRATLIHELAHIKRGDLWVNSVQTFLQVIYFYNPFVWFANSMIRKVCEEAVDETVLVALGGEAEHYSNTLIDIGEMVFWKADFGLSLIGVAESKKALQWRIRHMLNRPIPKSSKLGVLGIIVVIIFAAVLLPMARAQRSESGSKPMTEHDAETALVAAPIPIQTPTFRKIQNLICDEAQLSPDGKSIALGRSEKLCIIPRDITLGPNNPVVSYFVNTAEIKVDPFGLAWSGNGRWIAFNGLQPVRNGKRVGNYRMYVVSAQGGKPKEVYDAYRGGYAHNRQMSLSPNGRTLAFSSVDANELHIYALPVEGGVPKRLVDVPAREPVFSPDGKMIAYVEDKNLGQGGGGLCVVPATGGIPRQIAEASNACSPIWSPDGRMIAFFDWNNRDEQIWIVPINEDGERAGEKVTIDYPKETGGLYRLTGWTPDNKIGAIFKSTAEYGLYTLPPNGEPATLVTHAEKGSFLQPRWSPDGKRIIYTKSPAEDGSNWMAWGLASIAAEGGRSTMIPIESDTKMLKAGWGGGGSISPDGKTILFAGCKAEEAKADIMHVWTLPMEGGKPTQLTNAPAPQSDKFPCWAPDGKAIAFVRTRDSQNIIKCFTEADIFILPAAGGEPRQLTAEPDMVAFGSIAWSPDGRLLAYFALNPEWPSPEETTIRVIPAEGGQSRVVAKLGKFDANMELAWSPDSRRIAFNPFPGSRRGIEIVSLDDGSVVNVDPHLSLARSYHLDWSRDGEKLVFAGYRGGQLGFWLMENFLPPGMDMKESK